MTGFCRARCKTSLQESNISSLGRMSWLPISSPGPSAFLLYMLQILSSLGLYTMRLSRRSRLLMLLRSMLGSLGKLPSLQSCTGGRPSRGRR
uniref:Uncharacterized protein n=1 Tax=Arundo donax TaxID=35708 RepID=A0A0A9D6I0_ARUDO